MKLLLVLFFVVTHYYCNEFPVNGGGKSGKVLTGPDTSVDYLRDTTKRNSTNDFRPQHGSFDNRNDWIKEHVKKIVQEKHSRFNYNSGFRSIGGGHSINNIRVSATKKAKWPWAFLGIGLVLLVKLTCYLCKKDKKEKDTKCEVQYFSKESNTTRDFRGIDAIPLPEK